MATYSLAGIELSPAAYDELVTKLRECGHGFRIRPDMIDMQGTCITRADSSKTGERTFFHCDGCGIVGCGGVPERGQPPKEPSPEWLLRARAEGRAEFFAILTHESAEEFPNTYIGSHALGDTGDYGAHWEGDKLRELFKLDDHAYSYMDRLDGTYWSQMHEINRLEEKLADFRRLSSGEAIEIVSELPKEGESYVIPVSSPEERLKQLQLLEWNVVAVLDGLGSTFAVRVREGGGPEDLAMSLAVTVVKMEREIRRLDTLINTPHILDFLDAVKLEAAHQRERWGTEHDAGKTDTDWLFLIGFLGGKAIEAGKNADLFNADIEDPEPSRNHRERRLHHIIAACAAGMNWYMNKTGADTRMRPGIAGEPINPCHGFTTAEEEIRREEGAAP